MPFTPLAMFEVVQMVAKRPTTAGGRRLAQTTVPAGSGQDNVRAPDSVHDSSLLRAGITPPAEESGTA